MTFEIEARSMRPLATVWKSASVVGSFIITDKLNGFPPSLNVKGLTVMMVWSIEPPGLETFASRLI